MHVFEYIYISPPSHSFPPLSLSFSLSRLSVSVSLSFSKNILFATFNLVLGRPIFKIIHRPIQYFIIFLILKSF